MRQRCLREARRLSTSEADAEDIVQEALARAWRSRHRFTGAPPVAWLLTVTRNEARRHHGRAHEHAAGDEMEVEDHRMVEAVERVAVRVDVRRVLRHLPHEDRRLVVLRYALELSNPELAQMLDLPEGTIKVRLHRARVRMRGWLEETYE